MSTHENNSQKFDIVLFGATSFVGKITAQYLVDHHGDLRIAWAGRNQAKLESLNSELGVNYPLVSADVEDESSISAMVTATNTVISTVGPYARWGEVTVKACVENGRNYVDLCGEALFIRRMIDKYHAKAQETGAAIIHACGFDSVPSDMGMLRLHQKAQEPLAEVTMVVDGLKGGLSGGTIDSMREQAAAAKADPALAELLENPFTLNPDPAASAKKMNQAHDPVISQFDRSPAPIWLAPFMMGPFNSRVVRRSNALLDQLWGDKLHYREAMSTKGGFKGLRNALKVSAATVIGFKLIQIPQLRQTLSRFVPEPGKGPSTEALNSGFFRIIHYGVTESGREVNTCVTAQGDPGYKVTPMMLSEAAVTLVKDGSAFGGSGGGILTPATGLGLNYLERLRSGGMSFS
ncbi:saccharopine dehydrogenase family protein [Corynebacterium sp. ZY180755]